MNRLPLANTSTFARCVSRNAQRVCSCAAFSALGYDAEILNQGEFCLFEIFHARHIKPATAKKTQPHIFAGFAPRVECCAVEFRRETRIRHFAQFAAAERKRDPAACHEICQFASEDSDRLLQLVGKRARERIYVHDGVGDSFVAGADDAAAAIGEQRPLPGSCAEIGERAQCGRTCQSLHAPYIAHGRKSYNKHDIL